MPEGRGKTSQPSTREPVAIGSVLKSVEYYLKGNRQNLLAVQAALGDLLPAELAGRVQPRGLQAGVLTLAVPDAAGKCLLEALLRGTVFDGLRKALPQTGLRKVNVVLT